jgi:hypothetical protein
MSARLNAQISRHPAIVASISLLAVMAFYVVAGSAFA